MSRIVIHIGAPKTGSTFLQRQIRAAPEYVRAQGIHVPVLPQVARMAGNAKLLASSLSKEVTHSFGVAFPDIDPRALDPADIVTDLLADWDRDGETLLLSAENFRASHAATLRSLLPGDADVTVVLFIRRQDLWVTSYFNQLTKTGDVTGDMDDFLSEVTRIDHERICTPDWYAHWSAWADAFGTCRVVVFDEVRADLMGALLDVAGLPALPDLPDMENQQVSIGPLQLAYLLDMQRHHAGAEYDRHRRVCLGQAPPRGPRVSFLSPEQHASLASRYGPSNRKLLSALGRPETDTVLDIPPAAPSFVPLGDIWQSDDYKAFRRACADRAIGVAR